MGKRRPARVEPPKLPETLHTATADHTTDLHGMRAQAALNRVDNLLQSWTHRQPGAVLRIVTGKGNRSSEGPVLLGAVEDYLRDELGGRISDMTLDAGGGGWLVRIRKR